MDFCFGQLHPVKIQWRTLGFWANGLHGKPEKANHLIELERHQQIGRIFPVTRTKHERRLVRRYDFKALDELLPTGMYFVPFLD